MGNALAREVIRLDWSALALGTKKGGKLLGLLAKAKTRMKCVSMNPDERALLASWRLMHELNVRGPHIHSPASLKALSISLDTL